MFNYLANKNIIVAITGSIAAYKGAELVRLLRQENVNVQVVMTQAAAQFITPLTLQALSGCPVRDDLLSLTAENAMGHIELARWADSIVIAPASANTLARLAQGFADDLLTTLCLATHVPVAVVPAMNQQMWQHPATAANIKQLKEYGYQIWGPGSGEQACGDVGLGRMLEPQQLLECIAAQGQPQYLAGKQVLITAGATREALDPVRCLTNISSGKMGYALAQAASVAGAEVTLVSGITALATPVGVKRISVDSALAMRDAVMQCCSTQALDYFIATAAVSDYRPVSCQAQKIKKTINEHITLQLQKTPDILAEVASAASRPNCVIGFAAETEHCIPNATKKLQDKKLDFIIANQVGHGQGIGTDDNAAVLIAPDGVLQHFPLMPKLALASQLLAAIVG